MNINNKRLKYSLILLVIGLIVFFAGWHVNREQTVISYDKNDLIRFHVIANSDSALDQALKYKVRDAVINGMSKQLKGIDDVSDARNIVNNNMNYIEKLALSEINSYGKSYHVKASLGNYPFPAKSYNLGVKDGKKEYLTLPEGTYEAVRVVIGEGKGSNWWCVLFPPLCFVNHQDNSSIKQKEAVKAFKLSTSPQAIDTANKTNKDIEIKFKFVELYNDIFKKDCKS
ncbi:MAG: stage II sporulation protein R [Clostridiales bacterium]|nr:stage II sporulation protein R [Clostridiales bacterium]MCF8021841.1 stage II sporulation protein R [Clostridiales bacterium]